MTRRALLLLALALPGCGDEPDRGYAATAGGARQEPYVAIPPGSVPRGTIERLEALAPPGPPLTPALLAQGRLAYASACAPCHGAGGMGDGPVVQKGYTRPPPLGAQPRSPESIVAIITEGKGAMPAMAAQVPPQERWAIARYIARSTGSADGE